jgi:prophage tail gpP-like protein
VLTFKADEDVPGNTLAAAEWKRNKTAAKSMEIQFPVNSWYAPNGELWKPNTTVSIVSKTIGTKTGFTFLITRVEYDYSKDGAKAVLQLKPPSVYSPGKISEPWLSI